MSLIEKHHFKRSDLGNLPSDLRQALTGLLLWIALILAGTSTIALLTPDELWPLRTANPLMQDDLLTQQIYAGLLTWTLATSPMVVGFLVDAWTFVATAIETARVVFELIGLVAVFGWGDHKSRRWRSGRSAQNNRSGPPPIPVGPITWRPNS